MSAFERTLKQHLVSYRIVAGDVTLREFAVQRRAGPTAANPPHAAAAGERDRQMAADTVPLHRLYCTSANKPV